MTLTHETNSISFNITFAQPHPGCREGRFLDVEGKHTSLRANQPGKKEGIMSVPGRSIDHRFARLHHPMNGLVRLLRYPHAG